MWKDVERLGCRSWEGDELLQKNSQAKVLARNGIQKRGYQVVLYVYTLVALLKSDGVW